MRRALLPSLLLGFALQAQAEAVDMLVFTNPGLFEVASDGRVTGLGGALIDRIAAISGVAMRIQVVPPARALQTLLQQPGSCVAGVPRQPDNEALLEWLGRLASSSMVLYGRADEQRSVSAPGDLRGAVIAAQRNSLPATWLRDRGLQLQEVRDTLTGLRMLQARRVDYWLVNELVARHTFQSLGGALPVRPLQNFGRIEAHLACQRDTAPATLAKLRAAVAQLHRDGELVPLGIRP